jgi:hypothetical protein
MVAIRAAHRTTRKDTPVNTTGITWHAITLEPDAFAATRSC